jgi:multiple sugar transport system substrate-binding protein
MYAPLFGADWVDESGKSAVAKDPGWKEMLNWQKDLTKELGADKLSKFVAGAGQEFSADHAFQTGSLAMMLDGEWRTAFIKDEAPGLDYATAPFPVADSSPELYGTTYTSGNILGIPKGAKNAGAAWELVKFLATDNKALTGLADSLQNVPTTTQALESAKDEATPQFKTFIDLFGGKMQSNPSSANGGGYLKTMQDFALNYATGRTQDLDGGLADVAKQIDDSATLGR